MKLNLGCGYNIKKGWINLDVDKRTDVDVVHDLNKFPYPFSDNQFSLILMDDVLEHLNDTISVMNEIFRIIKPGGQVIILFPYYQHPNAWVDPTHKKCLTKETFNYFVDIKSGVHNPVNKHKRFSKIECKYHPTWLGFLVYPFIHWLRHFCNILILKVEVKLTK